MILVSASLKIKEKSQKVNEPTHKIHLTFDKGRGSANLSIASASTAYSDVVQLKFLSLIFLKISVCQNYTAYVIIILKTLETKLCYWLVTAAKIWAYRRIQVIGLGSAQHWNVQSHGARCLQWFKFFWPFSQKF